MNGAADVQEADPPSVFDLYYDLPPPDGGGQEGVMERSARPRPDITLPGVLRTRPLPSGRGRTLGSTLVMRRSASPVVFSFDFCSPRHA